MSVSKKLKLQGALLLITFLCSGALFELGSVYNMGLLRGIGNLGAAVVFLALGIRFVCCRVLVDLLVRRYPGVAPEFFWLTLRGMGLLSLLVGCVGVYSSILLSFVN